MQVRVIPNAKAFRLEHDGSAYRIYVNEKAQGNRANLALQKKLGKLIGMKVLLLSGAKSRDKVLEIEGTENEVFNAFRKACAAKGAR